MMGIDKKKQSLKEQFETSKTIQWVILACVVLVFIIICFPNLVVTKNVPGLGDVAERDIKAPRDFFIEDTEATEENRKQAVENVQTVYDLNDALLPDLAQDIRKAFSTARPPALPKARPHEQTVYPSESLTGSNLTVSPKSAQDKKTNFEELLGLPLNEGAFYLLEKEDFSKDIENLIVMILNDILENGVVTNKELLLAESEKGIVLRNLSTKSEHTVKNLKQFYGLDQAKAMIRIAGQPLLNDLNYIVRNLVVDIVQGLIQPNITLNRSETEERKKLAAEEVKPVMYKIKAGEMILREGERVTPVQLLKLKTLNNLIKKEQIYSTSLGVAICFLIMIIVVYITYSPHSSFETELHYNKNLLFLACVLVTFLGIAEVSWSLTEILTRNLPFSISMDSVIYAMPLAAGTMVVGLFLNRTFAIAFALIISVCTGLIFNNRFDLFLYFFLNSVMGTYWLQNCRERKVFIKAGAKLGCLNVLLAIALGLSFHQISGIKLFWDLTFAFLGGITTGMVTAGFAPLIEVAFGYVTDITLMELANLEQPLLKRLMFEAPGTYHHSVVVGSLVEAAASEIGANPLLAKVCAYYHDIGKIRKPFYFIENQPNSKNPHDKLAPSMSRRILIAHVKEGVEIARENNLATVIIDTIKQHHGTSIIRYFYDKALKIQGEKSVILDDFRYPGPKPQTREAGLVMVADVVEAASRTLENPTPARIQGLVQNLINKVFSDGQLDNCELTLKDLHSIAKSFNKILNGIHHHRIEYAEPASPGNGKARNGSSDKQPPKQKKDFIQENSRADESHLKRLGMS
jgi:putative nucleotidyltransferase with HDIG domain